MNILWSHQQPFKSCPFTSSTACVSEITLWERVSSLQSLRHKQYQLFCFLFRFFHQNPRDKWHTLSLWKRPVLSTLNSVNERCWHTVPCGLGEGGRSHHLPGTTDPCMWDKAMVYLPEVVLFLLSSAWIATWELSVSACISLVLSPWVTWWDHSLMCVYQLRRKIYTEYCPETKRSTASWPYLCQPCYLWVEGPFSILLYQRCAHLFITSALHCAVWLSPETTCGTVVSKCPNGGRYKFLQCKCLFSPWHDHL